MKTTLLAAVLGCTLLSSCESTTITEHEIIYIDKSEPLPINVVPIWHCPHREKCSTHVQMYCNGTIRYFEFTAPFDTVTVATAHYGDKLEFTPRIISKDECPLERLIIMCGNKSEAYSIGEYGKAVFNVTLSTNE